MAAPPSAGCLWEGTV
uniref:Uncharacterized protein n=1 Tax=Anguilla anguilla TaxID=7936 RepID=A0A0E9WJ32_ANGAN